MKIADHRLVDVEYVQDNMGWKLSPEWLVIHYTVTYNGPQAVRDLGDESQKASVHIVVDKDGSLVQMVPFNRIAWHAGPSEWEGRPTCSTFMLGIEVVNIGPLVRQGDVYLDVYKRPYDGPVVEATHKNPACRYRYWAAYPDDQMQTLLEVGRLLVREYNLKDIVGHDDIAPGRKIDPGPAFPMKDFRNAVMGPTEWERKNT